MGTISTYGELWTAVRRQIERDLGADQIVALCPYGSLFRSREAGDSIDIELLRGTHAKTIDVIAVVRDMDATLLRLARALDWSNAELDAARGIVSGRRSSADDAAGRWQDRTLRVAIDAFRGTIGALLLRSAFVTRRLSPVPQPCPLYGQMLLADPLDVRAADGKHLVYRERYKIGVVGLQALLGPAFEQDLQTHPGHGYLHGVAELERAIQPQSSAYMQFRFLGQNPERCLRWADASARPLLLSKMHGLSCSAMHAAVQLLAAGLYPLPEPRRVGLRQWGFPIAGAHAFAWDELGQLARGVSFLAELAVKVMILRKHHSVFGPDGIYAREIMAEDADAMMFLDGLNDFLADYPEVVALDLSGTPWLPVRRIVAERRRRCLIIVPDHVSERLRASAAHLWRDIFARVNATIASTNALLQDTHRLLTRPQPAGTEVPHRGALDVIKAELIKSRDRFATPGLNRSAPAPIQKPWPLDPRDGEARTALARRWLEIQSLGSSAAP
jgi:hypothetical protein